MSKKFHDHPLMLKLTVYSTLLVVIPMMLVGWISYWESSRTLEYEARQFSWQIIEQVKHYVEDYLRDFELSTLRIVNHPDTAAFLKLKSFEEVNDSAFTPAVRNVLKNSAFSRSDVTNITLILDGIQTVSSTDGDSSVHGIEQEAWYSTMPVTGRPRVYSRLIEWKGRVEPVLSIVKRIGNPQTLEPFGMLVIDINYKRLHDITREVKLGKNGHGYLFILDEQGKIVYHPDASLIGTAMNPEIMKSIQDEQIGSFITEEKGREQLLTYSRSESLGWLIGTSIPYGELMSSRNYIGRTIMTITAISMALAFILSIALSASIVKPIKRLYQHMKRVEIGDLKSRVPVDRKDEIGKLSVGFNTMVERLSNLLEEVYFSKLKETEMDLRQKETELKMLQVQINPHFLYNSLDTIRGMALEHDIEEIEAMAASLARLLRYNVKDADRIVTVREEIDTIDVYLRIQQFRFGEKLECEFDMPKWAMRQQLAKFTLQPIVENAIVHALEQSPGTVRIIVAAHRLSADRFAIVVRDNGPGIPKETFEQLIRGLQEEHPEGNELGIGFMNVHRRIRHLYGEEYGLILQSAEGEGTEVRIVLPLETMMEGEDDEVQVVAG